MNLGMVDFVAARNPVDPPTQKTQPKKGKPVKIPVPKRSEFNKLLEKAAKPSATRRSGK